MAQGNPRRATFNPRAFEVPSLEYAKQVALTTEFGMNTEERWARETPFLVQDILDHQPIDAETQVLDFGCGPGRMSKALVEATGCRATGVDTSHSMRQLAPEYVQSDRFVAVPPEALDQMIAAGYRADVCVCLWVLQHAFKPMDVMLRIDRALQPGGLVYMLNQQTRCVPTDKGYLNDGFNVQEALARVFDEQSRRWLPETAAPAKLANQSVIQVLRKKNP